MSGFQASKNQRHLTNSIRSIFRLIRSFALLVAVGGVLASTGSALAQTDAQTQTMMDEALELHAAGKLDEALALHKKLAENPKVSGVGHYNCGCVYAMKNQADEAFSSLEKAVESKFIELSQFESDSDLDNIRKDPRFEKLITSIKAANKKLEAEPEGPLAGNWKIVSGTRSGVAVAEERLGTTSVNSDSFTIPAGDQAFVMSYKLDESKSPMEIDMKIEKGPAEGTAKGIVKLDGETMHLCYNAMGGERPTEFKTEEGDNCFYFELKPDVAELSMEALTGVWKIVEGTRGGEEVSEERMAGDIVFGDGTIEMGDGDAAFEMSFELNTESSPAEIDMQIEAGPAPAGAPAVGIMKIDSDGHLHLCYDGMGGGRPEKFESDSSNGFFLFKLKKQREQ